MEGKKYQQVQLLGTTETAKAYNPKAAAKNLKPMKDTGISTKTTSRIAGKAFGKLAPISDLAGYIGKAGAVGAVLDGGISLAESLINGDDAYAVFANTAAGADTGFVTGSAAALAGEAVTVVVVAAGGSGLITIIVPAAAAIGVGCLADYAMENLIDEDALAEAVEAAVDFAIENGAVVVDTICTTATNAY